MIITATARLASGSTAGPLANPAGNRLLARGSGAGRLRGLTSAASLKHDLVRVLDILLSGRVQVDLERALQVNELVDQAERKGVTLTKSDGTPYRRFEFTHVTMPSVEWDSMDFDRGLPERWEIGYERAREVLG